MKDEKKKRSESVDLLQALEEDIVEEKKEDKKE